MDNSLFLDGFPIQTSIYTMWGPQDMFVGLDSPQ